MDTDTFEFHIILFFSHFLPPAVFKSIKITVNTQEQDWTKFDPQALVFSPFSDVNVIVQKDFLIRSQETLMLPPKLHDWFIQITWGMGS